MDTIGKKLPVCKDPTPIPRGTRYTKFTRMKGLWYKQYFDWKRDQWGDFILLDPQPSRGEKIDPMKLK